MIGPLGAMLFSIFAPLAAAAYFKSTAKTTPSPATPSVISPQVTGATNLTRQRYSAKGRKSTLLTGGMFAEPSLLKQGLMA
jgi:hypothetical protein